MTRLRDWRLTFAVLLHQALTLVFPYEARCTNIKYICFHVSESTPRRINSIPVKLWIKDPRWLGSWRLRERALVLLHLAASSEATSNLWRR